MPCLLALLLSLLSGCGGQDSAGEELYGAVDTLYAKVLSGLNDFQVIVEIDHSRLARQAGEVMPPARVVIFSDPAINTPLLEQEPMAALDLPFRVLVFAEGEAPRVIYTPAEFLARRHGLTEGPALDSHRQALNAVVSTVPEENRAEFDVSGVTAGQGIHELKSSYGFSETIERLKAAILAEDGTLWFGEIDFQAQGAELGVELPALTLLLFGAPGPGAKAMAEYPRLGLDAFCQKLLVIEQPDGQINVYFNEMPAFAELHNGSVALPHRVIDRRMTRTLGGALEK